LETAPVLDRSGCKDPIEQGHRAAQAEDLQTATRHGAPRAKLISACRDSIFGA
jgi:hypothetical protein